MKFRVTFKEFNIPDEDVKHCNNVSYLTRYLEDKYLSQPFTVEIIELPEHLKDEGEELHS